MKEATDRAGFTRRWGIHAVWASGAPFVSLGVHLDWHTPTIDLHIGKGFVQLGRNQHDREGRISWFRHRNDGHTDQCVHADLGQTSHDWSQS